MKDWSSAWYGMALAAMVFSFFDPDIPDAAFLALICFLIARSYAK